MSFQGLCLRHICFIGPDKEPVSIGFKKGLNVICGASNTGKSFLVATIDYMLGAGEALKDIPERVGYDRISMGIETSDGSTFTLQRSVDGGGFLCCSGLTKESLSEMDCLALGAKHSSATDDNLSRFLLRHIGLDNKALRKNQGGQLQSLSFRNLAPLSIVNEEEIIKEQSPIFSGQLIFRTKEYAVFKLLLTGVDDSAIVVQKQQAQQKEETLAKSTMIEHLLLEYNRELLEITKHPEDLENDLATLELSINSHLNALNEAQLNYERFTAERREVLTKRQPVIDRIEEIDELVTRFNLLQKHYNTDIERLEAIKESGTFFIPLKPQTCPLCGALPDNQNHKDSCDGNAEAVVKAAIAEIAKIEVLHRELTDTLSDMNGERVRLNVSLDNFKKQLSTLQGNIEKSITPEIQKMRASYTDMIEQRAQMKRGVVLLHRINENKQQQDTISNGEPQQKEPEEILTKLPTSVLNDFAKVTEEVLQAWQFPKADRIYFDEGSRDLVISGKLRSSHGKGLRAITHAAFNLSLMEFCHRHDRAHPGFIVLDSPLLAYKEPEGEEDDLRGSDLKDKFYEHLVGLSDKLQILIIENEHPSEGIKNKINFTDFTGNPASGRQGFFPSV